VEERRSCVKFSERLDGYRHSQRWTNPESTASSRDEIQISQTQLPVVSRNRSTLVKVHRRQGLPVALSFPWCFHSRGAFIPVAPSFPIALSFPWRPISVAHSFHGIFLGYLRASDRTSTQMMGLIRDNAVWVDYSPLQNRLPLRVHSVRQVTLHRHRANRQ
jgi:hypothetical protein